VLVLSGIVLGFARFADVSVTDGFRRIHLVQRSNVFLGSSGM
jgi:hypothetical protein